MVKPRAILLTAALAFSAAGVADGLAQDNERNVLLGEQRARDEPQAAAIADVPQEPKPPADPPITEAQAEASSPQASAAPRGRAIEEIVVTAQRREQELQDVPISMSAFGGEFLREHGVTDLQDVGQFAPNVRIDLPGNLVFARIRGFATLTIVNRTLEQPVGLTVDEVPYGRQEYFRAGLFDLDRVEVLRGARSPPVSSRSPS